MALTRKTVGKTQFRFLAKYTPELNPIEPQWISCKDWIHSMPLKDVEHLAARLKTAISQGIIKIVKLYDFYTV